MTASIPPRRQRGVIGLTRAKCVPGASLASRSNVKLAHATVLAAAAAIGVSQFVGCASQQPVRRTVGNYIDDSAITAKIKTALIRDSEVRARDVNVTTYRGVVQLSGFVQDDNQVRRAGEVARSVEGVRQVYNDLRVAPRS
jgi:osmotically-inducible protein OsmY